MHRTEVVPAARPALWTGIADASHALRGHRLPWVAIALGLGIGIYFALPVEPGPTVRFAWAGIGLTCAGLAWWLRASVGFAFLLSAVVVLGGAVAQVRTLAVAGPVLEFRYYGGVEGRVVAIDRSASGSVRITLDRVRLDRMAPERTPRRVRLSLQDPDSAATVRPGARVMTTGHLLAPSGPAEPGGFDFQRHAWYLGLGAVGYTSVPVMQAGPGRGGFGPVVARARSAVATALRDRMPGQLGEVAAAITTGDRSGLSTDVTTALRASNLAHLLAISGLHMGLLVGFVFWLVRGGLALFPSIALHHNTRIWAAVAAFPFAAAYLMLSGGSVATQRAFVMAAVMLGAIVLGRRALSMRSIAIAAIVVLLWRPESLTGPGFQMSFAATGALILVFVSVSRRERPGWLRGWRGSVASLLLSSVVAGAATGPIAALHFNRIGHYGVLANMLAVPMMGVAVMPLLFIGLMLIPLGLEAVPLWVAGWGIRWILEVADRVADLPGAVSTIPAPVWQVLPFLGAGMAVAGAARSHATRAAGVALMLGAGGLWLQSPRPDVLISDDARLLGVMTSEGRWLSRESGVAFVAGVWLENDGDGAAQADAAARPYPDDMPLLLHHAPTKTALASALETCAARPGWLVTATEPERVPPGCHVLGPDTLRSTGAIALRFDGADIRMETARDVQGQRPWSRAP